MSTFYQQKILEPSKSYLPNRLTYVDPSVNDANENFSEYCFAFQVCTEFSQMTFLSGEPSSFDFMNMKFSWWDPGFKDFSLGYI